jgi:xanthine/uracil permease
MKRIIPIAIGVIVLLVGIAWASQGAGMMGGSGVMDNKSAFIYIGGFVAIIGLALIAFGAISKPRVSKLASA